MKLMLENMSADECAYVADIAWRHANVWLSPIVDIARSAKAKEAANWAAK